MVNKKNLWFLTLFSLILVLSVYYITMPSELLLTIQNKKEETDRVEGDAIVQESNILMALRLEAEDQLLKDMDDLKMILTNIDATVDEKNEAYEKMKFLNVNKGEEEKLETKIKEEFNFNSLIKIEGNQIRVVIESEEHNEKIANDIMRFIQSNYDKKMYITVKFQK